MSTLKPSQQDDLTKLLAELTDLETRTDVVFTEIDPGNNDHPLWEVWQPISTATARLKKYCNDMEIKA